MRPLLTLCLACSAGYAADAVSPGKFTVEPATLHALGFEWAISGDDNRNAKVSVEYRRAGDAAWHAALPLLRIGDEQAGTAAMNYITPRMFAGSVLSLETDTEYEVRLTMTDPDGVAVREARPNPLSKAIQKATVRTRSVPRSYEGGRVRHVYPKGYTGERRQPAYDGLLHAYFGYARFADWNLTTDPVRPGDTIVVHEGVYRADRYDYRDYHGLTFHGAYVLTQDGTAERPITIRGEGEVVFDGAGAYRLFDVLAADHHIFENLTVRNAEIAFYAGEKGVLGASGLTVRRCRIEDVGIGVVTEWAGSEGFYIADNVILGRMEPDILRARVPDSDGRLVQRVDSYFGVKVYGRGHVVEHNYVAYFYDGIDVSTYGVPEPGLAAVAIDFENNDIHNVGDNCIEGDGGAHNIRVIGNRCFNCAQDAYSFQPILGGPGYLIRNIGYHFPQRTGLKLWGMRGAGVLAYHNTFTAVPNRHDQGGSNIHFRNNIFLGPQNSELPVAGLKTYTRYSTMDYNAYRKGEGQPASYFWLAPREQTQRDYQLQHEPLGFESLDEFRRATGQERHSVYVDYDDFRALEPPTLEPLRGRTAGTYRVYTPEGMDFRLQPTSAAVDAGVRLPTVNDDYTGEAPDLGAYEIGRPLPTYGPRPADKP